MTHSAPVPKWADAVEQGRQIVRAGLIEQNLPGLSVAVGAGSEIVWAEGFGWADLEKRAPVAPHMRFRIGTASTALTSAAVGLLLESIDALTTTDPAGIITDVNRHMEALTGCTRDELIGASFKNYFTDPQRAEAGITLALREKKVTNYELTARARDGKTTVVSCNATPFYDRDRTLQGVFAAARDLTEGKHIEQMLHEKTPNHPAW